MHDERYQYARRLLLAMSELEEGTATVVDLVLTTSMHASAQHVSRLIDAHTWLQTETGTGFTEAVARAVQHHALAACPGLRRTP